MSLAVGLVGCGRWGRRHLDVLKTLKAAGQIDRIVVCDLDKKRLVGLGVDQVYSSASAMFSQEQLNGLAVVTPPSSHFQLLTKALNHHLPTLMEKPLSQGMDQVHDALELMDGKATVMVGLLLRHHEGIRRIRMMIDDGRLGDLHSFTYTRTTTRNRPEDAEPLTTLAVHGLDLLSWMFKTPLMTMEVLQNNVTEDAANVKVRTPTRQTGTVNVSWSSQHEQRLIEVIGSRGSTILDFGTDELTVCHGATAPTTEPIPSKPLEEEWKMFLQWARSGEPHVYPEPPVLLDQAAWFHRYGTSNGQSFDATPCEN